mgnify:CR=1 FL=1
MDYVYTLNADDYLVGFDINTERISELMSGLDSTLEVDSETLKSVLVDDVSDTNGLFCTDQFEKINLLIFIRLLNFLQ